MTGTGESPNSEMSRRELVAGSAVLSTVGGAGCLGGNEAGTPTSDPPASPTQARTDRPVRSQQHGSDAIVYPSPEDGHRGIQSVIEKNAPGVAIVLEPATYLGDGIDTNGKNAISMYGTGRSIGSQGTVLQTVDGADTHVLNASGSQACYFENIRFHGNNSGNDSGHAFKASSMWNTLWAWCDFREAPEDGLHLDGDREGNKDDTYSYNCRFSRCGGDGLHIEAPATRHLTPNIGNNDRGIWCGSGKTSIQVHGAQIYGNETVGIELGNVRRCVFTGFHVEGPKPSSTGLEITCSLHNSIIRDGIFVNTFETAVRVENYCNTIENCTFDSLKVIQGRSPSGRTGDGSIDVGFKLRAPNGEDFENVRVTNCGVASEDEFGTSPWIVDASDNGITIRGAGGYENKTSGQEETSHGGTIDHGLDETPALSRTNLWTASSNRAYPTATSATDITVGLADPMGNQVNTAEPVFYDARGITST